MIVPAAIGCLATVALTCPQSTTTGFLAPVLGNNTRSLLPLAILTGCWLLSVELCRRVLKRVDALSGQAAGLPNRESGKQFLKEGDELTKLTSWLSMLQARLVDTMERQKLIAACVHDAKVRRESEHNLANALRDAVHASRSAMMEEMPAGLVVLGEQGRIHFANPTGAQLLGRTPLTVRGALITDFVPGFASPAAFVELLMQRSAHTSISVAVPGEPEKKLKVWLSEFAPNEREKVFLLLMLDWTDEYKFNEWQRRLIAMIAHDIATPMSTVQGVLQLLATGAFGKLAPAMSEETRQRTNDCSTIVRYFRNIVAFEKLAAAFQSISGSVFSLKNLTREAVRAAEYIIFQKNIAVISDVAENIVCLGDAEQVGLLGARTLLLVANACEADATIKISASRDAIFVYWTFLVENKPEIVHQLQAYLDNQDALDILPDEAVDDLELVLWKLLLQRCGARVLGAALANGGALTLCLPASDIETPKQC